MARLFKLAYQLRMHTVGDGQQDVLARNLGIIVAAIIVIQWLLRGRPALPAWHWLILGLIVLGVAFMIVLRAWAASAGYIAFAAQPDLPKPAAVRMVADDKEATSATGRFEVEAKEGYLANLTAYWRTFGSREHAVMAIQHDSHFLLGNIAPEYLGMWYAFFKPEDLEGVTAGDVAFGGQRRPGLQISYRRLPPSEGKKKARKPVREILYLAFDSEAGRDRVWADLLAD